MRSDPALIGAFRKQAAVVLASGDAEAFVQLWAAWKDQADTCRDDLVDVLKDLGQDPSADQPYESGAESVPIPVRRRDPEETRALLAEGLPPDLAAALAEDAADAAAARAARASIEAGEPVVSWESVKGEAGL